MNISIIVPWRSDGGLREKIWNWNKDRWNKLYNNIEILEIDTGGEIFNRGKSRNLGVSLANYDIIVLADADTIPIRGFIDSAIEMVNDGSPWVVAYEKNHYYNLNKYTSELYLKMPTDVHITEPVDGEWDFKISSTAGMLVMKKSNFIPYDERFNGWGWEDIAFQINMDNNVGEYEVLKRGYAIHLWHHREDSDFNTIDELKNRRIFDEFYRPGWRDKRLL